MANVHILRRVQAIVPVSNLATSFLVALRLLPRRRAVRNALLSGRSVMLLLLLPVLQLGAVPPELRVVSTPAGSRLEFQLPPGSGVHYVRGARSLASLTPGFLLRVADAAGEPSGQLEIPEALIEGGTGYFRVEAASTREPPLPWLVWVPPGAFWLGSDPAEHGRDNDEDPVGEVTLTRGFWIARHEVTQSEYQEVMGGNPSYFTPANGYLTDLSHPVEQVSWADATNYCARLTERLQTQGSLPTAAKVRLPTEAEWEYAARAGTHTAYSFGSTLTTNLANFDWKWEHDTARGFLHHPLNPYPQQTLPVGSFPPNPLGLHDVHGNVWEWVSDWWGYYPGGPQVDPAGPPAGDYRLQRGGGWHIFAWHCRSANRSIAVKWWERRETVGLRVVVELPAGE